MTTFLIDTAVVGTVAFCGWRGYKGGLIRGVFGVVSLIVALLIANIAAQAYSGEAKTMMVPFVSGVIDSTITEMGETGIEYQALAHDHEIDEVDFGTAYTALRLIGLPEAAAVNIAQQSLAAREGESFRYYSDVVGDRLSSAFSYVAVFGIAFLLLAIAFAVVGNLVGVVFSLPGLKLVDIISGSALGLVKGLIIVYTIAVIIRYYGMFVIDRVEATSILIYLVNNNPIASMLGV